MPTTMNPATGEKIKEYPTMSKEETASIIDQVHATYLNWSELPFQERAKHMTALAKALRDNAEEYAQLMTQEMGKTITQARGEVEKCAWMAEVYAEKGEHWIAPDDGEGDGIEHKVLYQPLGVVYAIMPWNYPFWQALRFAVPVMLAGNTAILKHASNVTGCSLAIEELFKKAGFPDNAFRSIIVDHATSDEVIANKKIVGVSLTGSTGAGKRIAKSCAEHLKPVVLELGGSDPFIVLEDADLDKAVDAAVIGRFQNTGQSCIAAKRFIVHESLAEEFGNKFAEKLKDYKVGDPTQDDTKIGPVVDEKAMKELQGQIQDAKDKGARLLFGGDQVGDKGFFLQPTLFTDVNKEMKIVHEETFGPIAPIIKVATDQEAIDFANDIEFGLGGSVWSKDVERGKAVAKKVQSGILFVNHFVKSDPRMPFGGVKESGLGRECSHFGMKEFCNIKGLNVYNA